MAFARLADDPHVFIASPSGPKRRAGFFRRAFDAMVEARRHAAEREIAAFVERCGGKFTDDSERGIDRILTSSRHF